MPGSAGPPCAYTGCDCAREGEEWIGEQFKAPARKRAAEQIGRHANHGRGAVRYLKRQAAKLMRRLGRALLDDAPARTPFRGWSD